WRQPTLPSRRQRRAGHRHADGSDPTNAGRRQPALLTRFRTLCTAAVGRAMALIVRMKLGKVAERIARRFECHCGVRDGDTLVAELVRACLLLPARPQYRQSARSADPAGTVA
ncbi:hypothetical protein ACU4GD_11795, partial [Cupriavidus basilensis]